MYQTPTTNDFHRNLSGILQRTREAAHADSQRIRVEHAARGLGSSGPLISAVAIRFDELHAEAVDTPLKTTTQGERHKIAVALGLGAAGSFAGFLQPARPSPSRWRC